MDTSWSSKENIRKVEWILGVLLMVSPIGNFLLTSMNSGDQNWWRPDGLATNAKLISPILWLLWSATFFSGLTMLKGSELSWNITLYLLIFSILFQIGVFKKLSTHGWLQPISSIMVNLGLLGVIYYLKFHARKVKSVTEHNQTKIEKTKNKGKEAAKLESFYYQLNSPLQFKGFGPWAHITELSNKGLVLRVDGKQIPKGLEKKFVEIKFHSDLTIQARMTHQIQNKIEFEFLHLNTQQIFQLKHLAESRRKPPVFKLST